MNMNGLEWHLNLSNCYSTMNMMGGAGKCKYNANLQSDKKKFGTSQVSVVHFQVGWASGLQIVFF